MFNVKTNKLLSVTAVLIAAITGLIMAWTAAAKMNLYVPRCEVPSGFVLRKSVLVEVTPNTVRRSVWRKDIKEDRLGAPAIETKPRKAGIKPADVVEEYWMRDKDRINFNKIVCPDQQTLDKSIDLMLRMYAIRPTEMESPIAGKRAWIAKDSRGHGLFLASSDQLTLVMVSVLSPSIGAENLESLAKDVVNQALLRPQSQRE
ncbi:MAG: hypothetical protein ACYSWZ_09940 [Planctomycetota bacterium]|jgi:hypothetical protein